MRNATPRLARALLLTAALSALAACARHAAPDGASPEEEPVDPDAPTELSISNSYWLDIVIFIAHDGEASRVGTVTAASDASFVLPRWMLGQTRSVRLVADPVGAESGIQTELIHVQPGQFIEWRLESQLARSTVSVY
jgi:hypothetical protein